MEKLRAEILALIAVIAVLAAAAVLYCLKGQDAIAALDLRGILAITVGALIALLTQRGVSITSDTTSVSTDAATPPPPNLAPPKPADAARSVRPPPPAPHHAQPPKDFPSDTTSTEPA